MKLSMEESAVYAEPEVLVRYSEMDEPLRRVVAAIRQRVVRIYDPDRHIIEVGESMSIVVRRFLAEGLTVAQTAARMGMPIDAVRYLLAPETT